MATVPARVIVVFDAVGDAQPLIKKIFKIEAERDVFHLMTLLRGQLKLAPGVGLCCFVNQAFQPNLHQLVGALHANYAIGNRLYISYCTQPIFG